MKKEQKINIKEEIQEKEIRIQDYMVRKKLDGILIAKANNWAWITGGRNDRIVYSTEDSWMDLIITRDLKKYCISANVETSRLEKEDLGDLGYEVISYPWEDSSKRTDKIETLASGKRFASDSFIRGMYQLDPDFNELRYSLTESELGKYRILGKWCRNAVESTAKEIIPGMTEQEVSGIVVGKLGRKGIFCNVIMIGSDDRIFSFRHPLTTDKKIEKYVIIVICASKWGLVLAMTRLVHFGNLSDELNTKINKVTKIDAKIIINSRPEKMMKDFDEIIPRAYSDAGYEDMWRMHYQGGPIGYGVREYSWEPNSKIGFYNNQAFAWNPSITGTKSEDTFLYIDGKIEFVSLEENGSWPLIEHKVENRKVSRPDILIR